MSGTVSQTPEQRLLELIARAEQVVEADGDYWTRLATGQNTEEAEASGVLAGQVAGLRAALAILACDVAGAEGLLDLQVSR